jgi:methylmalonyl-CoA mutase cobalamin-binding subunit
VKRVRLSFAVGVEVEFCNRERAMRQVEEFAERGTRFPLVVFGPEGCGKTAWLKQATEAFRELGFEAIYVDPIRRDFIARTDVRELVDKLSEAAVEAIGVAQLKLATLAMDAVKWLISRWRRENVAVLVDDAFQAIGLDKAATYVKALLGLVEYPPEGYERVVAIVATSEGVSRAEIGRHRWATIRSMWNMSGRGFEELYEKIPGPKPGFEEVWRLSGGNPGMLAKLYQAKWDFNAVVRDLVDSKKLDVFACSLANDEKEYLLEAIEDPDTLLARERIALLNRLVEMNLIVDAVPERVPEHWIDEPPPQKDLELGVGRRIAWQTPLHREAVKRALK